MDIKPTLLAISNDARAWLKAWAQDFTEADAKLPGPASRAPNPLAWQLGHIACVEDDLAQLFTLDERPEPLVPPAVRAACASGARHPTKGQGISRWRSFGRSLIGRMRTCWRSWTQPRTLTWIARRAWRIRTSAPG